MVEKPAPSVVLAIQTGTIPKDEIADFVDDWHELDQTLAAEMRHAEEASYTSYNECEKGRGEFLSKVLPLVLEAFVEYDTRLDPWVAIQIETLYDELYDKFIGFE
jgi:hypothetical protein